MGHWLSIRGALQGLRGIMWAGQPCEPLTKLREAALLNGEARDRRVHEIAEQLRLQHLSTFFERVAVRQRVVTPPLICCGPSTMKLRELAERLACRLEGDGEIEIVRVAGIEDAGPGDLTFVANPKYWRRSRPPAPPPCSFMTMLRLRLSTRLGAP